MLPASKPAPSGLLHEVSPEISAADAEKLLSQGEGLLLRQFGAEPQKLMQMATQFGLVGQNYRRASGMSDLEEDDFPFNVVKVKPPRSGAMLLHEKAGGLRLHSARSWAKHRPKYFMLVMVEPGWRDFSFGLNGESLYAPWRSAIKYLAETQPSNYNKIMDALRVPITFTADNVIEDVSHEPIIYAIDNPIDEYDFGVRMKQDLVQALARQKNDAPIETVNAIGALQDAATELAWRYAFSLESGDLVIINNNRWGHGRCDLLPTRADQPGILNPREVWSWTVG